MTLRPLRTKTLLIFWLRFAAWVLDKPHNLRRRLGQLQRVRGAASVVADQKLPPLSVMPEVQK